jgi:hypothetical protein
MQGCLRRLSKGFGARDVGVNDHDIGPGRACLFNGAYRTEVFPANHFESLGPETLFVGSLLRHMQSPKRSTISISGDSKAASSFALRSPYAVHHRSMSSRTGRTAVFETGFVVESRSVCQSSDRGTPAGLYESEYVEFVKSRVHIRAQKKSLLIS